MDKNAADARLQKCHICEKGLEEHPLHSPKVARICQEHGDFFIQENKENFPEVVFREIDTDRVEIVTGKTQIQLRGNRSRYPGVRVRCDQTGQIFEEIQLAARSVGVNPNTLRKHLSGSQRYTNIKGYSFTRITDEDLDKPFVKKPRVQTAKPARAVRCDQTGEIFDSITKVAAFLHVHRVTFMKHLDRHPRYYPLIDGYSFSEIK